jgi:hypothetical protein
MKRKTLVLWTQAMVACAAVYVGQQSIQAQGIAPHGPGGNPDWLPANKTGFGTSYTTASNVWFTLQGGRLSEIYYRHEFIQRSLFGCALIGFTNGALSSFIVIRRLALMQTP